MKKTVIFVLALMAVAGFLYATGEAEQETMATVKEYTWPLEQEITVTFAWPTPSYRDVWPGGDKNPYFVWLKKNMGINLIYDQAPQDSWPTKVNLMLATGDLPDFLSIINLDLTSPQVKQYFVNLLEYEDQMPNFFKILRTNEAARLQATSAMYAPHELYTPVSWNEKGARSVHGHSHYRVDLFQKYNLKIETWEDVYESLKVLKREYPDSYPFGSQKDYLLSWMVNQFRVGFLEANSPVAFNWDDMEHVFAPEHPMYKEAVEFFAKLYSEGLLHPSSMTASQEEIERLVVEEKVFWFHGGVPHGGLGWAPTTGWPGAEALPWAVRGLFPLDNWSGVVADIDSPDYGKWLGLVQEGVEGAHIIPYLIPENSEGVRGWAPKRNGWAGGQFVINKNSKNLGALLAFIDEHYKPTNIQAGSGCLVEGFDQACLTFGLEGENMQLDEKGRAQFMPHITAPYNPDGRIGYADYYKEIDLEWMSVPTYYLGYGTLETYESTWTGGMKPNILSMHRFLYNQEPFYEAGIAINRPPQKTKVMDAAVSDRRTELNAAIKTYADEEVAKFIFGQRPLSQYDAFLKTCKEMGSDELLKIYRDNALILTADDVLLD